MSDETPRVGAIPWSERWLYRSDRGRLEGVVCATASAAWALGARLHRAAPRARYRAPCAVLSVGALSVGGVGKTPMALRCVRELVGLGARHVLLALRGYARDAREVVLVDAGQAPCVRALARLGDEATMLLAALAADPGLRGRVTLGVGAQRAEVIAQALRCAALDVVVLDDGLQHHGVARDLDLVVLDPDTARHAVLPAGPLREPVRALPPGALLQVHGGDGTLPRVERLGERAVDLVSRYAVTRLVDMTDGASAAPAALAGAGLALVTAVGRNRNVRRLLEAHGLAPRTHHALRDHARFERGHLVRLARAHDALVTTAKDWPRLRAAHPGALPCPVFVVEVEIELAQGAPLLRARLAELLA